jgi:uncharacterized protein YecE (DUF72 family)
VKKKNEKGKIFIGTSGFYYNHWSGTFYPPDIKKTGFFKYYQRHFNTVELNSPFYRLPSENTFKKWKTDTPDNFIFAVKASRYITHVKKLLEPERSVEMLFNRISHLKKKLGPVLFQLPPSLKKDEKRLENLLDILPQGYRFTFEFRNHSWYDENIYKLLEKHNVAFCIYELQYHMAPIVTTADFVYARLHGPERKYAGNYSNDALHWWAGKCKEWSNEGLDVYIYFDNDQLGYAAFNALVLKKLTE